MTTHWLATVPCDARADIPARSLKPSRIPLLIALRWGSDVPEQMTKKSVNDEIPRRSRTTTS